MTAHFTGLVQVKSIKSGGVQLYVHRGLLRFFFIPCNLESCRLDISGPSGYGGALSLLVMVETELACSLSSILSGKDSLEIGSSVEESFILLKQV